MIYLSTEKAAKILGLSERRVSDLCLQGRLGQRIGRNWAITLPELKRFKAIDRPCGQPGHRVVASTKQRRANRK